MTVVEAIEKLIKMPQEAECIIFINDDDGDDYSIDDIEYNLKHRCVTIISGD